MAVTDEIVEGSNQDSKPSGGIKILAVLTYISKGFILLIFALTLVALFTSEDLFVDKKPDSDMSTTEWLFMVKIMSLLFVVSSIGTIIGALVMVRGKKKGFTIYGISSVVYCVIFFYLGIDIIGVILIGLALIFMLSYWRHVKKFS